MKTSSKFFLFTGVVLALYAVFSRFYGEPSVALKVFSSVGILTAANTLILISISLNQLSRK
ncbi:MAG: hypothetical protein PHI86_00100 [Candidatus Omnitrophica bacterium]|nr:hypothetical protein [Candidatus Omnitrophota bacterium]